ncbi:MAG: rod shape-determining protein RodA [Cytophagales bacterium]|nr:rod shape-determining protein RodA [Cytophagales bacterium]
MSTQNQYLRTSTQIDWVTVLLFMFLVIWGWLNIFAAVYDPELQQNIFDFDLKSGKQLVWIVMAVILAAFILMIDFRFFESFSYFIYMVFLGLLLVVLVTGKVVAGSKSWLGIGTLGIQPSEFIKFATALALSNYLSAPNIKLENINTLIRASLLFILPATLILLQNDTGSTLVFSAFIIVLYREGLNPIPIVLGIICAFLFIITLLIDKYLLVSIFAVVAAGIILFYKPIRKKWANILLITFIAVFVSGFVFSVNFIVNNVLQPHQQNRIKALINPDADPLGFGWNVTQSKIAIGSGGFLGKGFLEGTQTKFDFVPEQHTDFIFCTIGEEWGWLGSTVLIGTFITLFLRLLYMAERQKSKFARVYGYCVLSIMFFHFLVNIGMTIGLFPVIGIPLPFFSYGGSSLWGFTILLFIFINLDAHRMHILGQ